MVLIFFLQKEQADGDYQNLVFCIMVERNVDLQGAIDVLTNMIADRVDEYVDLKSRLQSFGPKVDIQLHRYLEGLEHFVQGTVVWYYCKSPRTHYLVLIFHVPMLNMPNLKW